MQSQPLSATLQRLAHEAPSGTEAATRERVAALAALQRELGALVASGVEAWLETVPGRARQAAAELVAAGGKRLRPMLTLLAAEAAGGPRARALPVATAVELLHTGTLLHDDVIDQGELRRGAPAACVTYGNSLAVLAGDFCFFAALDALLEAGDPTLVARAVAVARELARGELLQLEQRSRPPEAASEARCLEIIACKTASLFAFATWGGARAVRADASVEQALEDLGLHLGRAFQITDDILDLSADPATFGKNLGQDLQDGTPTLPLLYALRAEPALAQALARFDASDSDALDRLRQRILATGALEHARHHAHLALEQAHHALDRLAPGPATDGLRAIVEAVRR